MVAGLSYNDAVLVTSLLYLSLDMQYEWHEFVSCKWPVHRWLLGSYVFILAFRLIHVLGAMHATMESGDFLMNLRHKETLPQFLMSLTWAFVLPLFAFWTAIGSFWLYDSKKSSATCLPMGLPLYFIITWQALSYAWILIHTVLGGVAWRLENRLRHREDSLRAIEDPDTLGRWGQVSQLPAYTALANTSFEGLTPQQIKQLPETTAKELMFIEDSERECSICLTALRADDPARQLAACGHVFHRSCIDLWLLRRADCPLCKSSVVSSMAAEEEVERWHV
jgi:hypothetical protein